MPLLGTLHFCLLPLSDLSHMSQGYVEDQNHILQLLATASYLTSNPSPGQTLVACFQRWGCGVYLLRVGIWNSHTQVVATKHLSTEAILHASFLVLRTAQISTALNSVWLLSAQ